MDMKRVARMILSHKIWLSQVHKNKSLANSPEGG